MKLGIQKYKEAENAAQVIVPNKIIEAFSPAHFKRTGYPTDIEDEKSLRNWVDAMHEGGMSWDYENLIGGVTKEEFELCKEIIYAVAVITKESSGKVAVPRGVFPSAIRVLRLIKYLCPNKNSLIFEVGPGCGYLGALLSLSGYSYASMDITQGFYVYQSRLYSQLFPDRIVELATEDLEFCDLKKSSKPSIFHVPWWKFGVLDFEKITLDVDLVVGVDVLCEMHQYALRYLGRLSKNWLTESPGEKFFLVPSTGTWASTSGPEMENMFAHLGFDNVFQKGQTYVFTKAPEEWKKQSIEPEIAPTTVDSTVLNEEEQTDENIEAVDSEEKSKISAQAILSLANPLLSLHLLMRTLQVLFGAGGLQEVKEKTSVFFYPEKAAVKVNSGDDIVKENELNDKNSEAEIETHAPSKDPGALDVNESSFGSSLSKNPIHERLISGYETDLQKQRVSKDEFDNFYTSEFGVNTLENDDEKFIRIVRDETDLRVT